MGSSGAYPYQSSLNFSSVHDEVNYWLNHTTQTFKGGYSGSGENGNDFGLPMGTPVYAVTGGKVVGAGYYGGGGVVSIEQYPGRVWYYQHLDYDVGMSGEQVSQGQLIGYSGGQLSGGLHPASSQFSGGPHIEVGIDAPWSGIWGGGPSVGPNIDPRPVLQALLSGSNAGTGGTGALYLPQAQQTNSQGSETSTGSQHCWSLPLGLPSFCVSNALYNWVTQPIRWLKIIGGTLLIIGGFLLFVFAKAGGPALQVAGVASGQPELVAAGGYIRASRVQKRNRQQKLATQIAKQRAAAHPPTQAQQQKQAAVRAAARYDVAKRRAAKQRQKQKVP